MSLLSTACLKTEIPTDKLTPSVIRLANLNRHEIPLSIITTPEESPTLGRQFLLFFIPFGRITPENFDEKIFNATYQALALKGYKPVEPAQKYLKISVEDYSLFAYDFFFLRRISANISLKLEIIEDDHTIVTWRALGHSTAWKEFAFSKQLNYVFNKAVDDALEKALQQFNPKILINKTRF